MSSVVFDRRHALGLPAGSVRAIHVLLVTGLAAAIIANPRDLAMPIPAYLIYLLFLMLGHYFAAHGVTIASGDVAHPKPLYLPGGTVRLLVMLALGGAVGWKLYSNPEALLRQFELTIDVLKGQPLLPVFILGGFFIGVLLRGIVGRANPPQWLQNFEAWVSLLAIIGLSVAAVIHLIIEASLEVPVLTLPTWEAILGGVVAFYFGARS